MIENMKDLKEALSKIPDGVLENFFVCENEDAEIGLATCKGDDEDEIADYWHNSMKKYEELNEIKNYFMNIVKEARKEEGDCEPITSEETKETKEEEPAEETTEDEETKKTEDAEEETKEDEDTKEE